MLNEMRCLRNQLASSEEEESLSSDEIRAFLDSKQQADNA
jgi:hypothetical protein